MPIPLIPFWTGNCKTVYRTDVADMHGFNVDLIDVFAVQEVLLFPAMKPDIQKKKDEADVRKSDDQ